MRIPRWNVPDRGGRGDPGPGVPAAAPVDPDQEVPAARITLEILAVLAVLVPGVPVGRRTRAVRITLAPVPAVRTAPVVLDRVVLADPDAPALATRTPVLAPALARVPVRAPDPAVLAVATAKRDSSTFN